MAFPAILTALISPISNYISKSQERKENKESANAKLNIAKVDSNLKVELTDAEWEAIALETQNGSFKDEYLTVIITSPILLVIVGSVYGAWTGDPRIMEGTLSALAALKEIGINMGELMYIVVLAGVGLKVWRGK